MTLAGHSDSKTTRIYTDLAGEMLRAEAARMEAALWGAVEESGRKSALVPVLEEAASA